MKTELQATSYKLQGAKMSASSPRRAVLRAASVGGAAPGLFNWLQGLRSLRFLAVSMAVLLSACASFPTTEEQVAASEPQAPELDIQSWRTEGGAKVLFVESDALPMLDIRLVMDAGSARDGRPARPGCHDQCPARRGG